MFGHLKGSLLARNTLWTLLGQGARAVIQAVYFIILARLLGAQELGAFIGTFSLVHILAQFSGLGTSHLLVKYGAKTQIEFRTYWGNSLAVTLCFGPILMAMVLIISQYILPSTIPFLLVVTIAAAEILFWQVLDISQRAFQAHHLLGLAAQLLVAFYLLRLGAVLVLRLITPSATALQWGSLYLLSTILGASLGSWVVYRKFGSPKFNLASALTGLKEGFYFSLSIVSDRFHEEVDKTMLARLSTLGATGIYGAAYRLIDVSFTPVHAMLYSSYATFFQHGAMGIGGSLRYARRLLPYSSAYSMLVGATLYVVAPVVPHVLGSDYQNAVEAVRWLALLPFLKTIQYFVASTLTGSGFQTHRSSMQVLVAMFNVLLLWLLIPTYSWRGAAWASLASETLLLLSLSAVLWYLYGKEQGRAA